MIRAIARSLLFTANTIRYRVEWPRLREAFIRAGHVRTLFDGGCGSGEFARRALAAGFCEEVIGLEMDDDNFRQLRGNLGRLPRVRLMQASLLDIPLPDASVDMVMCTQVIEHIADHEAVARELVRILRPGGHAIITVPHPPEPFPNDGHVRKGYTDAELRLLFEPLGMEVLTSDYFLTRDTTGRMLDAWKLPARGIFMPVAWVDRETRLPPEERRARDPFGILMLFPETGMKLRIIDPNVSLTSPGMKGVVRALPALKSHGWEIEVWCWHCDDSLPVDRVIRLPRIGNIHTLSYYAFSLWARLRRWWCQVVRQESAPDVTFSFASYEPVCDVALVQFSPFDWERRQRSLGTHSLRDVYERAANLLALFWTRRYLRGTAARVVLAVSDAVAADVRAENAALNVRVLPNCYDATRFHDGLRAQHRDAMRARLGIGPDETVFVFVSMGHYRRKGFFLAAEAARRLQAMGHKAKLLVVGGSAARLQSLQREMDCTLPGWKAWTLFTGMVTDVEKYFAAADAFLFPSHSEAFALVEVEAAASGLPLFLTRHHGSEMILEEGVNGRFLDFEAGAIASVLAEFVTGAWRMEPGHKPRHALDAEEYAARLAGFLAEAASAKNNSLAEHVFALDA